MKRIEQCPICNTKLADKSHCMFCDDDVWFVDGKTIWRHGKVEDCMK